MTELDAKELARFRAAVQPIYTAYAAGYEDLLARIAAMAEE